jgi:hypothetical protein
VDRKVKDARRARDAALSKLIDDDSVLREALRD